MVIRAEIHVRIGILRQRIVYVDRGDAIKSLIDRVNRVLLAVGQGAVGRIGEFDAGGNERQIHIRPLGQYAGDLVQRGGIGSTCIGIFLENFHDPSVIQCQLSAAWQGDQLSLCLGNKSTQLVQTGANVGEDGP